MTTGYPVTRDDIIDWLRTEAAVGQTDSQEFASLLRSIASELEHGGLARDNYQRRCSELLGRARDAEAERDEAKRSAKEQFDARCREQNEWQAESTEAARDLAAAENDRDRYKNELRALDRTTFHASCSAVDERLKEVERQAAYLRRQLTIQRDNNERRNKQLDALHFVWCNGGCSSGVHRWTDEAVTEELVCEAERNTARLRNWFETRQLREARSWAAYNHQTRKRLQERLDGYRAAAIRLRDMLVLMARFHPHGPKRSIRIAARDATGKSGLATGRHDVATSQQPQAFGEAT